MTTHELKFTSEQIKIIWEEIMKSFTSNDRTRQEKIIHINTKLISTGAID